MPRKAIFWKCCNNSTVPQFSICWNNPYPAKQPVNSIRSCASSPRWTDHGSYTSDHVSTSRTGAEMSATGCLMKKQLRIDSSLSIGATTVSCCNPSKLHKSILRRDSEQIARLDKDNPWASWRTSFRSEGHRADERASPRSQASSNRTSARCSTVSFVNTPDSGITRRR